MPLITLRCSVCKGRYYSKPQWLDHLQEEKHRSLARVKLVNWEQTARARVLVVFARLPVGKDDKIIQYLSKDFGIFVTDFVWWPERPRVGFVQFESKEKAKGVMGSLHNQQFRIGEDQLCEVKDGGSFSELEWDGLLPETIPDREDSRKTMGNKLEPDCGTTATGGVLNSERISTISSEPQLSPELSSLETSTSPRNSNSAASSNKDLGLRHHLHSIQKLIEIPDEEYDVALDILHRIQEVLSRIKGNVLNAAISRNWNAKIQYTAKDIPSNITNLMCSFLIYKYTDSQSSSLSGLDCKLVKEIWDRFERFQKGKKCFLIYRNPYSLFEKSSSGLAIMRYIIQLPNSGRRFPFNIITNPSTMVETQVWRLTKYLCTFDPHCHPVLSLAYYWANVNFIAVGREARGSRHDDLPDPSGLNCLLMYFLQKIELIPAISLVLEQQHEIKKFNGVDLGFSDSPEFSISWKTNKNVMEQDSDGEEFAKTVFTLLYKFFLFCGTKLNDGSGWIINTRDGELYSVRELVLAPHKVKNTKLSESELKLVKSVANDCCNEIVMLHPFKIEWRISVCNAKKAFRAMKTTGKKLKTYLTKKSTVVMDLEGFLQLLKV